MGRETLARRDRGVPRDDFDVSQGVRGLQLSGVAGEHSSECDERSLSDIEEAISIWSDIGGYGRSSGSTRGRKGPLVVGSSPGFGYDLRAVATSHIAMSDRVISHYELIEQIGRGGMGVVYKARDTRLDRVVALKFLPAETSVDPEARRRFHQEARAISSLEHRNICVIHDIDEADDGRLFLAMAFYSGESLQERLRRSSLGVEEAVGLSLQIAEGLEHAHSKQVLHRDIKPGNIIITDRGEAKIVDFGLAKLASLPQLTKVGTMMGTLRYMAPEQARGEPVDQRADIWSLGVVINEMVTRRPAFAAQTEQMALYSLFHDDPDLTALEDLSAGLASVVRRCLAREKAERFSSVSELMAALRALQGPLAGAESPLGELPTRISVDSASLTAVIPAAPAVDISEVVDPSILEEESAAVFVGRDEELARLDEMLQSAISGRGSVALVSGEVGCGRTALVSEFCRRAERDHEDLIVSVGKCNAHTGAADPYSPFRQVLAWLSGDFEASGSSLAVGRDRLQRAWEMFPESVLALTEMGPDLLDSFVPAAGLLARIERLGSAGSPLASRIEPLLAQRQESALSVTQAALLDQCTRVVQALSRKRPLVIILEDLHWVDAASVGLLSHLGGKLRNHRILILGTYRRDEMAMAAPEERHPLLPVINQLKREYGDIELSLGADGGRAFIDAYLDTRPNDLGESFREALYRQTLGLPLFTIELLRDMEEAQMLVEDSEGRWVEGTGLDWGRVPARTEATLADRVERLPQELVEMLGPASVQGELFSAEVVARAQEIEPRQAAKRFSGDLDKRYRLVAARGVKRVDGRRLSEYSFRHILYQKYLYSRLDEVERSYLHEAIGSAIEELYGKSSHEVAVDLARHYEQAGLSDKAIAFHRQAAANATRLSANLEAVEHLQTALGLVPDLVDPAEKVRQEFEIQTALGPVLTALHGFTALEVEQVYARARELSDRLQDAPGFRVLWGLFAFYAVRAEFEKSLPLAEQMLETAGRGADDAQLVQALYAEGVTHFFVGDLERAATRLGDALARAAPDLGDVLAESFAQDSRKVAASYQALILWLRGRDEDALIRSEQAVADAREDMHPFTLSTVCLLSGFLHLFRRQAEDVQHFAERVIDLSEEHSLFQVRDGSVLKACGRVLAASGGGGVEFLDEAIGELRKALDEYRATGSQVFLPLYLAELAQALIADDRISEAIDCLEEADAAVARSGERFWAAEIARLRGEAMLRRDAESGRSAGEAAFRVAFDTARAQEAIALELRAAISLAKQLRDEGRTEEAKQLLVAFSSEMSEEIMGADLVAAKRLLNEIE